MRLKEYLYKMLISDRLRLAEECELLLKKNATRPEREAYQVEMFNRIWSLAYKSVPFYASWRKKYDLPAKISDLGELKSWPVLTKTDLRDVSAFRRIGVAEPKRRVFTGGSTGEPIRLPSCRFAEFRPKFVIGFSPAVLAFVRTNKDKRGKVESVRAVFCSAGALTDDEKKEIEAFFNSPVCMELGF